MQSTVSIKDIVKDNVVEFRSMESERAQYAVLDKASGSRLVFDVPLSDVGDATLGFSEKAIMFMRYIRKALDAGTMIVEKELPEVVSFGAKFVRYRHGQAYFSFHKKCVEYVFPVEIAALGRFEAWLPEDVAAKLFDEAEKGGLVVSGETEA